MTGTKYRKKPVVIEAMRWTGDNGAELRAWSNGEVKTGRLWATVDTLEGEMRANIGDWVIRGVQGEFYPCKPDIFEATYEAVAGDAAARERRRAEHVTAWPFDNSEAVAALMLYVGPVENREWDWFEAVGVVETIVRHQVAAEFDRLSGNRNPDDPEGSAAYSRWAMNAADRIRHPANYEGCAASQETAPIGGSNGAV